MNVAAEGGFGVVHGGAAPLAGVLPVLALSTFNSLDAIFTTVFVQLGVATEANPAMRILLQVSPQLFILAKLAMVNFGAYCLWRMRDNWLASGALRLCTGAYAGIVGYHVLFVGARMM